MILICTVSVTAQEKETKPPKDSCWVYNLNTGEKRLDAIKNWLVLEKNIPVYRPSTFKILSDELIRQAKAKYKMNGMVTIKLTDVKTGFKYNCTNDK